MNRYEITYWDFDVDKVEFPRGRRVVVVPAATGRNGIEAIKSALRAKLDDAELLDEIEKARTVGSNKRFVLAGITFTANKLPKETA